MKQPTDIIGICSWTLGIKDLEQLMAKIAGLGLNGVQYCESFSDHAAADVKTMAEKYELEIIIFDPFDCRPGEKNGEATLENAIRFYLNAIDFAAELGCGQTLQGLSTWTENCQTQECAWRFMVEGLKAISHYAREKNVPLAYEPCNLYEVPFIHTAAEFQQLIDETGCTEIKILLDSFHMNIGENQPLEALESYAENNAVFHISDSNREGIGHGNIDFKAHFQALKKGGYSGPVAVEFILKDNPVNTPPRNDEEMENLSEQIKETIALWRSYAKEVV